MKQKQVQKMMLVGIDSLNGKFVRWLMKDGSLPNLSKIFPEGILTDSYSTLPCATSVNWTTIATGARAGTHGITGMSIHEPGESFDCKHPGFDSSRCKAEYLWQAGERAGKRSILLKYTNSWPPTIKKGIQVEGMGDPDTNIHQLAPPHSFTTQDRTWRPAHFYSTAPESVPPIKKINLQPGPNWEGDFFTHQPPLESELIITTRAGKEKKYYLLVTAEKSKGYDTIFISAEKDIGPAEKIIVGQWSNWIWDTFPVEEGHLRGSFRWRLTELSPDASKLTLYTGMVFPEKGWTVPEEIGPELVGKFGPYQEISGMLQPYHSGIIDYQVIIEEFGYQVDWMIKAGDYLLKNKPWDLFFTQWHGVDHLAHMILGIFDPASSLYDPKEARKAEDCMRKVYSMADSLIGHFYDLKDEETLFVLTSDHGHVPIDKFVYTNNYLVEKNLCSFIQDQKTGLPRPDWSRTRAVAQHGPYIFINLKGREPHGIVDPEDYEKTRDEVIRGLKGLKDPETGEYVMSLVLKKEDAGFLGLQGDYVGDIVYFTQPRYTDEVSVDITEDLRVISRPVFKGPYPDFRGDGKEPIRPYSGTHHSHLPAYDLGLSSVKALSFFSGPGLKKNVKMDKAINLIDIAPTCAHFMGFPIPAQAEGRVLQELLKV